MNEWSRQNILTWLLLRMELDLLIVNMALSLLSKLAGMNDLNGLNDGMGVKKDENKAFSYIKTQQIP